MEAKRKNIYTWYLDKNLTRSQFQNVDNIGMFQFCRGDAVKRAFNLDERVQLSRFSNLLKEFSTGFKIFWQVCTERKIVKIISTEWRKFEQKSD